MVNNLVKGVIVFIVLVILLELFIGFFIPQDISPVIAEINDSLGYKLINNFKGVHRTKEFNYEVFTNSKGFRDNEFNYEKQANTTRILFLGDSMTYGWGVEKNQRFTEILEKNLSVDVINAGVPGYRLSNMLAYFELEGIKLNPDVIIIMYNLNTGIANVNSKEYDVINNSLIKTNLFTHNQKNKLKEISKMIPFYSFLSQNSQLFSLIRNTFVGVVNKPVFLDLQKDCNYFKETWKKFNKQREILIINEFNNYAEKKK